MLLDIRKTKIDERKMQEQMIITSSNVINSITLNLLDPILNMVSISFFLSLKDSTITSPRRSTMDTETTRNNPSKNFFIRKMLFSSFFITTSGLAI